MNWPIIPAGVALLKEFEGFRENAYQDIVGVWTIGYGFTDDVKPGDVMSREDADILLARELTVYADAVRSACTVPPNSYQLAAMVVCAWNIGLPGFRSSSILKAHNRGDTTAAARAFGMWNKARVGGVLQPVAGLTRRRAAEAALYLTPMPSEGDQPMPQAVEPETPMKASTTQMAAVVAGASAITGPIIDALNTASKVKDAATGLGTWLVPFVVVAGLVAAGYIIWERWQHRERGNA